jgi:exodeoxyribonuclease V gamma subunit
MPGIYLYTGNRLEILADKLAEILAQNPLPPFEPETILVQSRGMARWLAMETASRLNIWANCDCPFPNTFINKIFRSVLPEIPDNSSYGREKVTFHLMGMLPNLVNEPAFKPVKTYLENDSDLSLYQLAAEIADLFDQYTIYRPDMILAWESDNDPEKHEQAWQSQLWRHLINLLHQTDQNLEPHRARLLEILPKTVSSAGFNPMPLPNRVSIFGISSLPPYHLKILSALARFIELHFFVINPCREFWADIIADRQIVRISREEKVSEEMLHLHEGNSLLASMGKLGRDMIRMLQDIDCLESDYFIDPGQDNLLSSIQQDILYLRERGSVFNNQPKTLSISNNNKQLIAPDDISILFQSCHSPMREIESLHDHLLGIFNNNNDNASIEPKDILVMTPSIEEYGPLIQAVFDTPTGSQPRIPHSIADRKILLTSNYIETFFTILSLTNSRFTNVQVISLLESEPVQRRFQVNDNDIAIIKNWIAETNIRWGIDKSHKERMDLPAIPENTWRAGLDRLLLGYAMPGQDQHIFKSILPYDNIEGKNTQLLGNFLDFVEPLFQHIHILEQKHSLETWSEILLDLKEKFLYTVDNSENESKLLYQTLQQIGELQRYSSFDKPVSIDVIKSYLAKAIEQKGANMAGSAGFLSGGITFCEMLPMRAIPFKVICLLGMNDGSYPRPSQAKSFDLMINEPRLGDRSRRLDDRYLFLESILSARQQLYISYVGQSVRDDSQRPPSPLVSELMDYIDQGYFIDQPSCDNAITIIEHLTTKHRLQPFHPDYFRTAETNNRSRLFSYSYENYAAATILSSAEIKPCGPIIQNPLPPAADDFKEINLKQFCNFFLNPAKYFLTNRLGIASVKQTQEMTTSEPFSVKGLERYILENGLLKKKLAGENIKDDIVVKKAAGDLPHGKMGEVVYEEIVAGVEEFAMKLANLSTGKRLLPLDIDLELMDFRINGQLDNIYENGLIIYRCATIKPKDIINSWIYHLILQAISDNKKTPYKIITYLVGKDVTYKYQSTPDSTCHLQKLLSLYWQGLTEPLSFFPQTSFAFARELFTGRDADQAMKRARIVWEGNNFLQGEKTDPYITLCFRDTDPFNQQFFDLATGIFLPLLEQQEKHTG